MTTRMREVSMHVHGEIIDNRRLSRNIGNPRGWGDFRTRLECLAILRSEGFYGLPVKVKGALMPTVSARMPPTAGPIRPPTKDAACSHKDPLSTPAA